MFVVSYSTYFKQKYQALKNSNEQQLIQNFIADVGKHGLFNNNFSFQGKIAPSWSNLLKTDPKYQYAQANNLWHYHVGYPCYIQSNGVYMTSDWIIHFIWDQKNNSQKIKLVDYSPHKILGSFPQPGLHTLV